MSEQETELQSPLVTVSPASPILQQQQVEEETVTALSLPPAPPQIVIVTEEENILPEPLREGISYSTADESETTLPDDESSSYSTVTPESLNEDQPKPIPIDAADFQGPVLDFYRKKNILMTGATGFIGKALLWKLIQALRQEIGFIYILVRSGSNKRSKIGRPEERLRNEIFNNKVCNR